MQCVDSNSYLVVDEEACEVMEPTLIAVVHAQITHFLLQLQINLTKCTK